jgi:hypothetical protein
MNTAMIKLNAWMPTVLFLLIASVAFSQNITTSTLSWEADESTDVQTNKSIAYQGVFKTIGTQSVVWIQKNGQRTSTYTVQSTSGLWANVADNGTFTYSLQGNEKACTLTLEKSNAGILALLSYPQPGTDPFIIRFHIKSVSSTP